MYLLYILTNDYTFPFLKQTYIQDNIYTFPFEIQETYEQLRGAKHHESCYYLELSQGFQDEELCIHVSPFYRCIDRLQELFMSFVTLCSSACSRRMSSWVQGHRVLGGRLPNQETHGFYTTTPTQTAMQQLGFSGEDNSD